MTFEDFLHESQVGYSTIETKDDLEYVIKRTWNAAIRAALVAVDDAFWDDCQVEHSIKKLLTS